ncbi:hypothetical protein NZ698_19050 [Chryseobacterium sp. PBS4-4]|uniref:Uncharacterized protein n=1 Tax=Chryseobacterium edaphi TaxID=2976532 RepID=A0ABT2WBB1_9FLAO|nr:hypothetical protein [Chryseobacterium edaphi]MCU7619283.1 hypothetical protein [Chryseobacterium edaphi]
MLKLFTKKYWYNFYLPSELFYSISEVNSRSITMLLEKKINFKKITIQKISNHLYYISICLNEEDLLIFEEYILNFKELIPPWLAFPNIFEGTPRWNQGHQEDYCIGNWLPYWRDLSFLEKNQYMEKYSCPTEWKIWLSENINF